MENLNGTSRTVNYGYDKLYRLTNETISAVGPAVSITYDNATGYDDGSGFDRVGNRRSRTSTVTGVPSASYSYDVRDRLNSDTYDDNGNTITSSGAVGTLSYDFEDRLVANFGAGGLLTMVYDGDGNRVSKSTCFGCPSTLYLVDDKTPSGYPQIVEESTSDGSSPTKVYVHGLRLISQRTVGASPVTQYYGYDGHGNVRMLLNADGTVAQAYTYDAFGIPISPTSLPAGNDYLYAGEQFDRDLGLYYLRARYYNPQSGRFWTMDTFRGKPRVPATLHAYLFVGNNPATLVDPSGHEGTELELNIAGLGYAILGSLTAITVFELAKQAPPPQLSDIFKGTSTTTIGEVAPSAQPEPQPNPQVPPPVITLKGSLKGSSLYFDPSMCLDIR